MPGQMQSSYPGAVLQFNVTARTSEDVRKVKTLGLREDSARIKSCSGRREAQVSEHAPVDSAVLRQRRAMMKGKSR